MRNTLVAVLLCLICFAPACFAEDDIINVFVVAHSHDDAGWLRTVDSYYEWEVSYLLDTVIACLLDNPDRKFIEVEMAFFTRWWAEQTDSKKAQVRELVARGQLEFINGGWVMNDEAVTNYVSVINQMTEGHLFLLENFGVAPKVAWHIDPFGASSVTPTLWAESGFEYFVINRIDYRIKAAWKETKELEFVWEGSSSLGKSTQIFTHILDSHYCTPDGFDWEHGVTQDLPQGDGPPVIITQSPSWVTKPNVHRRAVEYAKVAKQRAAWFKTNNVLIPFGCDFTFQNAWMNYKNMDKLITYINEHSAELGITAQYSTLTDYFAAVRAADQTWTTRKFDFFPYIDNDQSYWTGFYTSRPDLKQLCRETDSIMRNSEIMVALGIHNFNLTSTGGLIDNLQLMRKAAAVSQHHDAVTGTERRVTYRDYKKRLNHGAEAANNASTAVLQTLAEKSFSVDNSTLWNNLAAQQPANVLIYNSLEFTRTQYQKINIPVHSAQVLDSKGNSVPSEVHEALSFGETGYSLFFKAVVPPLGYAAYTIIPTSSSNFIPAMDTRKISSPSLSMSNEYLSLTFDGATGRLQSLLSLEENVSIKMTQSVLYYVPSNGTQTSGAYIFRPQANEPPRNLSISSYTFINGQYVKQLRLIFNESSITQVVRLYSGLNNVMGNYLDVEMHLGPLNVTYPVTDGKEYVTRFQTSVQNGDLFYTDDSGLEMQTRRTNYPNGRPGDYDQGVILAGNYYPVVSRMYLTEPNVWQFTVLTSMSHGGSSLAEGEAEIMVHRRLLRDDMRGVGQALDDFHETSPRFFILSANPTNSSTLHRRLANVIQYPMQTFYITDKNSSLPMSFSPLRQDLPYNIRIISMKQRDKDSNVVILRLMNIFESSENPTYAVPTSIDLNTIFNGYTVSNIEERSLTTNLPVTEINHLSWNTTQGFTREDNSATRHFRQPLQPRDTVVTLYPMEIRSFWLEISPN